MEQPSLFPEITDDSQPVVPEVINTEAIAAAGEARNRNYDPNARQSAAQEDLGGGIKAAHKGELDFGHAVDIARSHVSSAVRPTLSRNKLSPHGKAEADREPPKYEDAVLLTPEEKAAGREGLKRIRGSLPSKGL